jgi:catalase
MNPQASLRVGNQLRSTLLLQDINMIEALSHLIHERIPERYATFNIQPSIIY